MAAEICVTFFHGSRGLISLVKSVKLSQTQGRGNKFNSLIIDVWVYFFQILSS